MRARRSRRIALSTESGLIYADSSALVKLVIEEKESTELERYLAGGPSLATSRVAVVEVGRATAIANPDPGVRTTTQRLLASCLLIDVTPDILEAAATLASRSVRSLDAIHVASALMIAPDELVAYDRRLAAAAAERGISVASPGRD